MKQRRTIYTFCAAILAGGMVFAQQLPVAGLKGHKEYEELIAQTARLRKSEDSVQSLINRNRSLFENRTGNTEAYAGEIVRLESELYDLRSETAKLGTRIAQIEQEFISQGMTVAPSAPDSSETESALPSDPKESRNLLLNDFFTSNITPADLKILLQSSSAETRAIAAKADIDRSYEELVDLKAAYEITDSQEEVDRMLAEANGLIGKIRAADNEAGREWEPVYSKKIDIYMILLDKLGGVDRLKLEQLDQQGRDVRRAESRGQLAPNTAVFPLRKKLILSYETLLASNLGLKLALDSLTKETAKLPEDNPEYPVIEFKHRNLIIYSDINLDGKYSYSSVDSIPAVKIPANGVYYAVSVAVMSKPPAALSFFKGGQPLQKEVLADGRLRYTLGGFKYYADAQKAVNQLYKAGFKAPNIVAWLDGTSTAAAKAKTAEEAMPKVTQGKFNLEVISKDINASQQLREITDQHSPGKYMARISEGDNYIFTITTFTTREEAEAVAKAITEKTSLEVNILDAE